MTGKSVRPGAGLFCVGLSIMKNHILCPYCGGVVATYRNPFPTVDIIIEISKAVSEYVSSRAEYSMDSLSEQDAHGGTALPPDEGRVREEKPGIILIKRKNPPFGWALPGGFVDYGESLESAAIREAKEETSLDVELSYQLGAYSDPLRDPRHHTISVVFVGKATGKPLAGDDAQDVGVFDRHTLPVPLAFDHEEILKDYFRKCRQKT